MPTFTVAIRGTKFRPPEAREVARSLTPHEVVTIEPDPDNEFDPNALKIIARGQFIGYVQKDMAEHLAARLDGPTEAYVSEHKDVGTKDELYLIEITV